MAPGGQECIVADYKGPASILPRHEVKVGAQSREAARQPPRERNATSRCKQWRPASTKGLSDKRSRPVQLNRASTRPSLHQEQNMNLKQTARMLSFGAILGMAALSAPALAADGDMMASRAEVTKMANKDGMISKKDFMMLMEKKFDEMDKGRKGMLSIDDVMRIYGRSDKG
jgi:hypothetical protein